MIIASWEFESPPLHKINISKFVAAIAQLVEHDLAKVGVASSSLVCRSKEQDRFLLFFKPKSLKY